MTRSVEIPEEAVEAGVEAAFKRNYGGLVTDDTTVALIRDDVRAALAAALPYLAPAGDGGLRAALEKIAGDMAYDSSDGGAKIRAVLDAHPAVPQPVDREALTQALLRVWLGRIEDQVADSPEGHCAALADAVLALLAGEQSQVEK